MVTPPADDLRLRPVISQDCRLLFEWVNDPLIREWSLSRNEIPWNEHTQWFNTALADPCCTLYLALDRENEPVGQIRFDHDDSAEGVVSVSVAPGRRGRGLGARIIALGTAAVTADTTLTRLHAYIVRGNHASRNAFERCGFIHMGSIILRGRDCHHFSWPGDAIGD